MTIALPIGDGAVWKELEYCLRSLEKHLLFDFDVVIYYSGNKKPPNLDVNIKVVEREYPDFALEHYSGVKHYENYFDVLNKLKKIVNDDEVSEDFLWAYDDVILIKDITEEEIKVPIALYPIEGRNFNKGKWGKTIITALNLVPSEYCYETHLPRVYNKSKMRHILESFPLQAIPYAPSTLYFNYYKAEPILVKDYRVVFYGENVPNIGSYKGNYQSIVQASEGKTWLNYNNTGLTEDLKHFITEKFPDKSRFEV